MDDQLTDEHRANLDKLATYLESLPATYRHFDMNYFAFGAPEADFVKRPRATLKHCGTAACAVGHGPAAGVALKPGLIRGKDDVDWLAYTREAFGFPICSKAWNFLFTGIWFETDNTHHGAAKRIRWILAGKPPLEIGDLSYNEQVPA